MKQRSETAAKNARARAEKLAQEEREQEEHDEAEESEADDEQESSETTEEQEESSDEGDGDGDGQKPARAPRYDSKSFDKWVNNNPEKAAKLFARYGVGDEKEARSRAIKMTRKRGKLIADIERLEKAKAGLQESAKAEAANLNKLRDDAMSEVQPAIDIMEALSKDDFAGLDQAFSRAGKNFDDWAKGRLRRGVAQVQKEAENREIARLKAENEALRKGEPPPDEKKEEKPKTGEKPRVTTSLAVVDAEVDEDHAVREVAGWDKKIQTYLAEHYDEDLDEDTKTIDEAADHVLAQARKKLLGDDEEKPKPRRKASKVSGERLPPRPEDKDVDEDGPEPTDPVQAMAWRSKRARKKRGML